MDWQIKKASMMAEQKEDDRESWIQWFTNPESKTHSPERRKKKREKKEHERKLRSAGRA